MKTRTRPDKGIFICFTGMDGSGKTTQCQKIINYLSEKNYKCRYTRCRWDPILFGLTRRITKVIIGLRAGKIQDGGSLQYKHLKKTKKHIFRHTFVRLIYLYVGMIELLFESFFKVNRPLKSNKYVVCDRHMFDFMIDMSVSFNYSKQQVIKLSQHFIFSLFVKPDHQFLIDIPGEVGYTRKQDGTSLEYLEERRNIYLTLAQHRKMHIIDGTRPIEEIAHQVRQIVGI